MKKRNVVFHCIDVITLSCLVCYFIHEDMIATISDCNIMAFRQCTIDDAQYGEI